MRFQVLDIGASSLQALWEEVSRGVGPPNRLSVMQASHADQSLFEDVEWPLGRIIDEMSRGRVAVAQISSDRANAVVYPAGSKTTEPQFCLASMDLRATAAFIEELIESVRKNPRILFYCRSSVDSVILDLDPAPSSMTVENFPWDHWDLAEAALRSKDGSWVTRPRRK